MGWTRSHGVGQSEPFAGFTPGSAAEPKKGTVFLICTSAGDEPAQFVAEQLPMVLEKEGGEVLLRIDGKRLPLAQSEVGCASSRMKSSSFLSCPPPRPSKEKTTGKIWRSSTFCASSNPAALRGLLFLPYLPASLPGPIHEDRRLP